MATTLGCMSITAEDVKQGRINDELETKLESISAQMEANVERSRNAMAEWRIAASDKATEVGRQLDAFTHQRPWQMATFALFGGMVLGLICGCQMGGRR